MNARQTAPLAGHPEPPGHRSDRNAVKDLKHSLVPLLDHVQLPKHERDCHASSEATVSHIKRSLTRDHPPDAVSFLYSFKAARRAARAAAAARTPPLPLALPLRRRQRRSAGAKTETGPPWTFSITGFGHGGSGVHAPAAGIVQGQSEPIKAVTGRRATASVTVLGGRSREDGLDCPAMRRTCSAQAFRKGSRTR